MLSKLKTTSSAVTGMPSDQFAANRWKVQVRPSSETSQLLARSPLMSNSSKVSGFSSTIPLYRTELFDRHPLVDPHSHIWNPVRSTGGMHGHNHSLLALPFV